MRHNPLWCSPNCSVFGVRINCGRTEFIIDLNFNFIIYKLMNLVFGEGVGRWATTTILLCVMNEVEFIHMTGCICMEYGEWCARNGSSSTTLWMSTYFTCEIVYMCLWCRWYNNLTRFRFDVATKIRWMATCNANAYDYHHRSQWQRNLIEIILQRLYFAAYNVYYEII